MRHYLALSIQDAERRTTLLNNSFNRKCVILKFATIFYNKITKTFFINLLCYFIIYSTSLCSKFFNHNYNIPKVVKEKKQIIMKIINIRN